MFRIICTLVLLYSFLEVQGSEQIHRDVLQRNPDINQGPLDGDLAVLMGGGDGKLLSRNKRSYGISSVGFSVIGAGLIGLLGLIAQTANTRRRYGQGGVWYQPRPRFHHSSRRKHRKLRVF